MLNRKLLNRKLLNRKRVAVVLYTIALLNMAQPASAQVSETSGKKQTSAQIAITIGVCAIAMKILERFNIP